MKPAVHAHPSSAVDDSSPGLRHRQPLPTHVPEDHLQEGKAYKVSIDATDLKHHIEINGFCEQEYKQQIQDAYRTFCLSQSRSGVRVLPA